MNNLSAVKVHQAFKQIPCDALNNRRREDLISGSIARKYASQTARLYQLADEIQASLFPRSSQKQHLPHFPFRRDFGGEEANLPSKANEVWLAFLVLAKY